MRPRAGVGCGVCFANGAQWSPIGAVEIRGQYFHIMYHIVVFDRTRPWQTTTGHAELHALPHRISEDGNPRAHKYKV